MGQCPQCIMGRGKQMFFPKSMSWHGQDKIRMWIQHREYINKTIEQDRCGITMTSRSLQVAMHLNQDKICRHLSKLVLHPSQWHPEKPVAVKKQYKKGENWRHDKGLSSRNPSPQQSSHPFSSPCMHYDISLKKMEAQDCTLCQFPSSTRLFDETTMTGLDRWYQNSLQKILISNTDTTFNRPNFILVSKDIYTCSLPGKLKSRSACIITFDSRWKKAMSLFLNPEKKLE